MLAAPTLCGLSGMILLSDDASTIAGHHGAWRMERKGEIEGREGASEKGGTGWEKGGGRWGINELQLQV
jgi:hypothetical protein